MRRLTNSQIDYIRKVVQSNGAHYYEVAEELTDHLVIGIENLWLEEPLLSFEQALQIQLKDFDKDNFSKIKKANEKIHFNKYKALFINEMLSFFGLPQIVVTIAFLLCAIALVINIDFAPLSLIILLLAIGSPYFLSMTLNKSTNKNPLINKELNIRQRFLIDETFRRVVSSISGTGAFIYIIISVIPRYEHFAYLKETLTYNISFAFVFTLLVLTNYICWFVLYPRFKKEKQSILQIA